MVRRGSNVSIMVIDQFVSSRKSVTRCRLLSAIVNSLYSFWWDIAKDWGLTDSQTRMAEGPRHRYDEHGHQTLASEGSRLDTGRRGPRKTLLFSSLLPYHSAVVVNFVLRLTWSAKLSPHLHRAAEIELGVFILEVLEVLRRWLWVYFRVEFETIKMSNAGERMRPEAGQVTDPLEMHRLPL